MERMLKRIPDLYWLDDNNELRNGPNPDMTGDCSELWGDCSGLTGDCTGLTGDCSGLWGDLDACNLTDAERENGVDVNDLVCNEE